MTSRTLLLAWLLIALGGPLAAQERDLLATARGLRDAGDLKAALAAVQQHLRTYPLDGQAHWLGAQLAYWSGDRRAARAAYDAALAILPDDHWLRVDAGRFHVETGRYATSVRLLTPVLQDAGAPADARAEAAYWLATAAYWQGDIGAARRRAARLLAASPEHERGRELLASLRAELRPWLHAHVAAGHDNQPVERLQLSTEAGGFAAAPLALSARGGYERLSGDGVANTVLRAAADARAFVPGIRARVRAGGGVVRSTEYRADTDLTAALEVRVPLPPGADLRVTFHRERYGATLASVDTLLLYSTVELALDAAERAGWAGLVAYRRDAFPDGNAVRARYGWLLLPVLPGVRAGYAVSLSDADSSTWRAAAPGEPVPRAGRQSGALYAPYYTPSELLVHTALLELQLPVRALDARVSGGYAVYAREQAPFLDASGALGFYAREPSLWHVRATASVPAGKQLQVRAELERRVATYYRATHALLSLVWRPAW